MQDFNMKQWLMENKSGMFSKTLNEINPAALGAPQAAADAEMQKQDDENGDMVDNVSMGVAAEAYFMGLEPDPEKYKIQTDKNGSIVNATNEDGETFQVGSLVKDPNGRDAKILGFKGTQGKVKAITSDDGGLNMAEFDINGLTLDEIVGYAMITKPSDPNRREPLEM